MWWVLTDQHRLPGFTTLAVLCTTNVPDHLWMAWQYFPPTRVSIWRTIRGRRILCGFKWRWDNPFIAEQLQSGDTINHSFHIRNLTPASTIWWYNYAPGGPYDREIQGPLNSVTLMAALPPPTPIPDPIIWDVPDRLLRCGNKYTFWAYSSWYALVPTTTSLTIWILIGDTFHRLDQANEPTPIAGAFRDADARLDTLQFYIHVAAYDHAPSPDPHLIRYAKFDITHHTWGPSETVHEGLYHPWAVYLTSLALDVHDRPHIIYTRMVLAYPVLYYRNKLFTTWSAEEEALSPHPGACTSVSCAIDPTRNAFHCACVVSSYRRWYNTRPCGGPFNALLTWLPDAGNLPYHSLSAGLVEPHIAQTNRTWRIDHCEGRPPTTRQIDISDPMSVYANMITAPHDPNHICIVFTDDDRHLAYLYRTTPPAWDPQVQLAPDDVSVLTAHYAHPNIISCLWRGPGFQQCGFFAFTAPW